ncbi:F0F1 ATP synthase subunit alpha [Candidatus Methylacidiphilum infernorum]|uniref:ATP synthase subunit alpha n=1 Tax=Candidatus Methylacidiphilum infernorum TaxID=511746 RepID=A0ABX7PSN7_9BACT|nr:F0F1 ATP synthase subunit alpha [Candidatus Methylacidiphilum infernorum]QSR85937.1 F0F1 ATP synthase subunit alpha [Candidatus Methylacidiphilum infernorum]
MDISLLQEIEEKLSELKLEIGKSNVGVVREIGDGVVKIEGLSDVGMNEVIEFPQRLDEFGQPIRALCLNLEETEVGGVVLGNYLAIREGDEVRTTGKLLRVPVGKELLGRVINPLGQALDGKGPLLTQKTYPVEKIAPGIVKRRSVNQPVQTGIVAIDAMIPIGRGQRELIIGDRSTGKTTIAIDTIINQAKLNRAHEKDKAYRPLYSIYVAVGQKNANISRVIDTLEKYGALAYTVVVVAGASDPVTLQYLAPFAGTAIGEWFMDNGMDALIVYDDLSKHAAAYRQISLVLKRPSGREAYPGDIFYLHSRLLERSARLNEKSGGGSLTALPIIETQAGDVSAYIPTNVISITDGQIYLETDLFYQGIRPAINVGLSVSRVGSSAQIKAVKQVAGKTKLELAQFRELAAFAQFATDLDPATKAKLDRGSRIVEIFKQPQYSPVPVEIQVAVLWAVQNGYFDKIPLEKVKTVQAKLVDHLESREPQILESIRSKKALDEDLIKSLRQALDNFFQSLVE